MSRAPFTQYGSHNKDDGFVAMDIDSNSDINIAVEAQTNKNYRFLRAQIVFSFLILGITVLLVFWGKYENENTTDLSIRSSQPSIRIKVSNEYGEMNVLGYSWLDNALLLEPFKTSTLTVMDFSTSCIYDWTLISSVDGSSVMNRVGIDNSIDIAMQRTGLFSLTVKKMCGGQLVQQSTYPVYVKYVRRELRSLTTADRDAFLDAFKTLYDTNTVDGRIAYGALYKSVYYLVAVHVDAAGNPVCDEFHSGAGFLSNHVFMSNYLEQSLQLINPRVSLPYWEYVDDFTSAAYQQHVENQFDGGAWSALFSSDYFGSVDPVTGSILDGRWKGVQVPTASSSFYATQGIDESKTFFPEEEMDWFSLLSDAHLRSPYGLLRPPWNYNPSTVISRFQNIGLNSVTYSEVTDFMFGPSCDDTLSFLTDYVVGKELDSYLLNVKEKHTKVHDALGGQRGVQAATIDGILREQFSFDDDDLVVIAAASGKFYKKYISQRDFYSSEKYSVYPVNCSANPWQNGILLNIAAPGEENGPSCSISDYYSTNSSTLEVMLHIFFDKYMHDDTTAQYATIEKVVALTSSQQQDFLNLVVNRMPYDGDMVGSASAIDPIFWVSHGAVEKMFQKIIMANLLTDLDYSTPDDCSGHSPDGKKAWLKGYKFDTGDLEPSNLTNAQLIDLLNPTSNLYAKYIPYVYDNSASSCESVEVLFSNQQS